LALATSIAEVGLLHPIVVNPAGKLIAGERRLAAAKLLGWNEIPTTIVDLDAVVRGEWAENAHRKDFALSEAVAIKRALEPLERARAKERMLAGRPSENFSEGNGNALDKVAIVVGKHRTTIAKAGPLSMLPKPSPTGSASLGKTWTEPAASMACSGG
jgi:ParB/RepB/Spo0J family partition protein